MGFGGDEAERLATLDTDESSVNICTYHGGGLYRVPRL